MRKLLEQMRTDCNQFIKQRDDLLMIAPCSDNDSGIALQVLRDIEQADATHIFLLFADSFTESDPFVSVAVERLKQQHSLACAALAEKGKEPLPSMPAGLFHASHPPALRLRDAICFARSFVPREGGHRLVWAMFPQQIANRREYLRLVSTFVPLDGIKPWMAGIRLIFRDMVGTAEYAPGLTHAPRTRLREWNLGPAAVESSLQSDAANKELSVDERMQSLFSLALLDYAHNRGEAAIAKFNVLLGHYQRTGNNLMQAVIVNGVGDVFHRQGDFPAAQYWYECAVPMCAAAKDPLAMATVSKNLGDVSYKLGRYAEAEQYYDGLDKLCAVTLDPGTKIYALKCRGLSQEMQDKYEVAIASLEAAALLSRNMNFTPLLGENLEHLVRLYRTIGRDDQVARVEEELRRARLSEAKP